MDRPKLLVSMIIVTSLFACEPPVTFTEPQPTNTISLKKLPKRMWGNYKCVSDSSWLSINDKYLIRIYDWDMKKCIADLDSTILISGDTAINTETNERTFVSIKGDSLVQHVHLNDTIFAISSSGVLKKFKGYYFINSEYGPQRWEVKKMSLTKGILSLSSIQTPEEFNLLQEIAENPVDTLSYHFKISKNQFRTFVKADGFSNTEFFVKVK